MGEHVAPPSATNLSQRTAAWPQHLAVALSGLMYAIALKYFVLPSHVILTGTEGIATAIGYYVDDDDVFLILYTVFQAALLGFAAVKMSRVFALRSAIVVATVVGGLALFPELQVAEPDSERILLVLFGGIIAGAAKAIALRNRGSTGDEDILAAFFATRYLKPVGAIAVIAGVVSTTFGLALELIKTGALEPVINTLMYTSLYIFASTETLNNLYRRFHLTMLTFVTREVQKVGEAIVSCSEHRTYTVQDGVGGRTSEAYGMVRTILTQEELVEVIDAVERVDPSCFYYHHDIEGVSTRYYIPPIN
jgi:uncharacterized membrane-anchored protein YitT (DUF2179 family)